MFTIMVIVWTVAAYDDNSDVCTIASTQTMVLLLMTAWSFCHFILHIPFKNKCYKKGVLMT